VERPSPARRHPTRSLFRPPVSGTIPLKSGTTEFTNPTGAGRCNYGDGSRVAAENVRQTVERMRALVEEQQQQIAQMADRLARYEDEHAKRPAPAIH
jgi:hypothetical protein